jgi:putative FmdB family regulatory protein
MPIYEYRCQKCRRRFSIFWRTFSDVDATQVTCKHCGADNVTRLVSRVRVVRSEDSRMEDMADPSAWGDFDENDPGAWDGLCARWSTKGRRSRRFGIGIWRGH